MIWCRWLQVEAGGLRGLVVRVRGTLRNGYFDLIGALFAWLR